MAIGHIAVRTHHRARGHTAAAALAYRAGAALTCSRTGEIHDYRRREQDGQIAHTGIHAPVETPLAGSLDALAVAIETAERRQKSRICRDVQMALPAELDELIASSLRRNSPSCWPPATTPSRPWPYTAPTPPATSATTMRT